MRWIMKLLILHIGDMHFEDENGFNEFQIRKIADAVNMFSQFNHVLIIISGDVAYSGKSTQYATARSFVDFLFTCIREMRKDLGLCSVLCVPGNHDMDYSNDPLNSKKLQDIRKVNSYDNHIENELKKLSHFMAFAGENGCFTDDKLHCQRILQFDDFHLEVNLINSAVFSILEEDKGLHYIPQHCINRLSSPTKADFVITIMHHSPDWFTDSQKNTLEAAIHDKSSLVFYGHEHYIACKTIANEDSQSAQIQAGGVLCHNGNWNDSSFYAGVLDTSTNRYLHLKFVWNQHQKQYEGKDNRSEYLPQKPSVERSLRILPEFLEKMKLDEKQSISKNFLDYYVFPRIQCEESINGLIRDYTIESEFIDAILEKGKVIISGGYNSGKTSLLKYLFLKLSKNYTVLYCSINNIRGKNFDRMIKYSFSEIYGDDPSDFQRFSQISKEKRILIVDDFDQIGQESFDVLLDQASSLFGCLIFATKQVIDLDLLDRMKSILKAEDSLFRYTILPFYADKRSELIGKVVALKVDNKALVDEAIKSLSESINAQRRFIPLDADFTIKYVDYYCRNVGDPSTSDSGVFSRVFEASLANALSIHQTSKLGVDKLFRLLAKVAHYIHFNKAYPIKENEVLSVIKKYNDDYGDNVDFFDALRAFREARILIPDETSNYRFANRSFLAYFVASEVNNQYNLTQDISDINNLIKLACFGINSDILLFLSYITDNLRVLTIILQMANRMTENWPEFDFSKERLPKFLSIEKMHTMLPPASNAIEQEKTDDLEVERKNVEKLKTLDIYDYIDEDAEELINQIVRAAALLSIIAKALPNFEHNMLKGDKDDFIEAIYRLPNKIFGLWSEYADKTVIELVEFFREQSQDYYHRQRSVEDDDILKALQWTSISLLLDLYNISAYFSTRENTFDYLTAYGYREKETYSLEHLIILFRRGRANLFVDRANELNDHKKANVFLVALGRIVTKALVFMPGLDFRQQQQLLSEFFPKESPRRLLTQRKASGYIEKE